MVVKRPYPAPTPAETFYVRGTRPITVEHRKGEKNLSQPMEKHLRNHERQENARLETKLDGLHGTNTIQHDFSHASLTTRCRIQRVYRLISPILLAIGLATFLLRLFSMYETCFGHFRAPRPTRLIRFSATHEERVPSVAISYLLGFRDALDEEGTWIALSPPDVDVEKLRMDGNGLLDGVSDEAIRALAGREGYRVGYLDITEFSGIHEPSFSGSGKEDALGVPYDAVNTTAHPEYKDLIKMVSADELRFIVGNLSTGFKTRYYRSAHARAPAEWIRSYLEPSPNSTVILFENSFHQPNVIARLSPPNSNLSSPTVLLGGHLDSTSQIPLLLAPGADDDASGTAVVMHVISILAKSGWVYNKAKYPIEAHAYGGEEGGLLGSIALSTAYTQAERDIRGVLNVEMVGWQPEKDDGSTSTITVLSDPNAGMSEYMTEVVDAYVPTANIRRAFCGYGCSDHYAWAERGHPVVCIASYGPNDKNLNPNYHSTKDRMDSLDFERMADFARATLAWVVQVAG